MMPSYVVRLLLLSSASFFLVQLVVSALVAWKTKPAVRRAASMPASSAARMLLTLRLLPAAAAALIVAAICIPSYLRFEPAVADEEAGFLCVSFAALGAVWCGVAACRGIGAWVRSALYVRRIGGVESRIAGETVWIVPRGAGLALAGLFRPRLLLSEAARTQLSPAQLEVALLHERAHWASRDNWKRLLILLAPPLFPALRLLDRTWAKCAEWAADDQAAQGDADRSATLAEALIRVARLQSGIEMPSLVTCLVEADEDLSQRVDRLLALPSRGPSNFRVGAIAIGAAVAISAIAATSLHPVHRLLELLLD
jgi:hypothetical protein